METLLEKDIKYKKNLKVSDYTLRNVPYCVGIRNNYCFAINTRQKPTESELEILQILWKSGPSSLREIIDLMNESQR